MARLTRQNVLTALTGQCAFAAHFGLQLFTHTHA